MRMVSYVQSSMLLNFWHHMLSWLVLSKYVVSNALYQHSSNSFPSHRIECNMRCSVCPFFNFELKHFALNNSASALGACVWVFRVNQSHFIVSWDALATERLHDFTFKKNSNALWHFSIRLRITKDLCLMKKRHRTKSKKRANEKNNAKKRRTNSK